MTRNRPKSKVQEKQKLVIHERQTIKARQLVHGGNKDNLVKTGNRGRV